MGISQSPLLLGATPDGVLTGTITAPDTVLGAHTGDGTLRSGLPTTNSYAVLACPGGDSSWDLQLTGTFGGTTVYIEASFDSTNGVNGNWINVNGRQTGVVNTVLGYAFTAAGLFRGNTSGTTFIRARAVGGAAINLAVILRVSSGVGAIFLNASIPAGTNNIGSVNLVSSQGSAAAVAGVLSATGANTPGTVSTTTTTGQVVANVASAGNATFHLVTSAFVGTLIFEGSLDGGLNYSPVMAIREDGTGSETGTVLSVAAAFIRAYTVGIPGFGYFRVRATAVTSGTVAVYIAQGPFLVETNPSLAASTSTIGAVRSAPTTSGAPVSNTVGVAAAAVLAANTARVGLMLVNAGTTTVYLNYNGTAPTTALYSWRLDPGDRYDLLTGCPTGQIQAIGSAAGGTLLVTELS